jgi:Tfp pilus assembly protein PilO
MRRGVTLIAVLVTVLVTGGWYLVTISPTNVRLAETNDQLEAAKNDQLRLETQLKRFQRIQENQLLYVEALAGIEAAVPPTPQQAALLDDLSRLEAETGVLMSGVTQAFPQEIEGQDYRAIPINIIIEGQYFEVLGFVYGLEDLPRIVVIKSISMSSSRDDEGFTILRVNIDAETYTSGDVTVPAPPEGAEEPADGSSEGGTDPQDDTGGDE